MCALPCKLCGTVGVWGWRYGVWDGLGWVGLCERCCEVYDARAVVSGGWAGEMAGGGAEAGGGGEDAGAVGSVQTRGAGQGGDGADHVVAGVVGTIQDAGGGGEGGGWGGIGGGGEEGGGNVERRV